MKTILSFLILICGSVSATFAQDQPTGAWQSKSGDTIRSMIVTPGYFTIAIYTPGQFISTYGGTWQADTPDDVKFNIEFNATDKSQVGKTLNLSADFSTTSMVLYEPDGARTWERTDYGDGVMPGYWQITGREQNGKMNNMPARARKTVKILSGKRFQWIAMNTETGEFFGSGGGTYSFENGQYTENIEFFSRDNSRVGASLSFNGSLNGNEWDHSGKSSKGEPIHEIWTRTY